MIDKEKLRIGLEEVSNYFFDMYRKETDEYKTTKAKEYCDIAEDALSLLKEQEPRVMTLDEFKAFNWDYCYLEEERLPGKVYRIICGDYAMTCITWPCVAVASMRMQYGDDNYGKKWRCWSAKPTDEQRKAVKWDEDNC